VFAKINNPLNQVPDFRVFKTPSVFLFHGADPTNPVEYFGQISEEQFMKWLKRWSKYNWVIM
jgi:hypothetical protein